MSNIEGLFGDGLGELTPANPLTFMRTLRSAHPSASDGELMGRRAELEWVLRNVLGVSVI